MKKITALLLLGGLLLLCSCSKPETNVLETPISSQHVVEPETTPLPSPAEPTSEPRTLGNTAGNISKGGMVCEYEGWIYFRNVGGDDCIYRMEKDGANPEKLTENAGMYINIYNERLYYINADDYFIYSMNLDGSDNSLFVRDKGYDIMVVDGWMFYTNADDSYKLYKIRLDGGERTRFIDESTHSIFYADGWIYYTGFDNIIRINLYSGERDIIGSGFIAPSYLTVDNGWVYFAEFVGDVSTNGIQRISIESGVAEFVTNDSAHEMYVYEDWVYYLCNKEARNLGDELGIVVDQAIFRAKTDGSEIEEIIDNGAGIVGEADGWLYYLNFLDNKSLYRVPIDGGLPEKVSFH